MSIFKKIANRIKRRSGKTSKKCGITYRSITSMEANILEHQNLISNPAKYMQQYEKGNWNLLDPRQQQHLLNVKWPGDIQRTQEQINILQGIIKSR